LFPFAVVPALRRALREFRPEVVQVHESDAACGARWLRRMALRGGHAPLLVALLQVSYVEERNAVRPLRARGRMLGRPGTTELAFRWIKAPAQILFGRWTARAADLVLVPSVRTGEEIERDYGVRPHGVLPNVTGARVDPPPEGETVEAEPRFLLYVGRLRIRKGVEVLLHALAESPTALPRLVVAGAGEHGAALRSLAARLGLGAERVRFLGRVSSAEVVALMRRAAALVVPSIYEGMPLVVLEAMAAGLPVVASAVSGIPEVVLDGETGWLVPPEDPGALATAISDLLSRPEEVRQRTEAARRRLRERYDPPHVAELWERMVEQAMARRRA
jgi:glycosyltransferase involved in cell wall biosynthesis